MSITTQKFNQLTAENFAVRLAQADLASKNENATLLNKKVTSNKTKHVEAEKKITDFTNEVSQI